MRGTVSDAAPRLVERTRGVTGLPVCVGLGVSTAEQAAEVAAYADGVIVGSAFIRAVQQAPDEAAAREVVGRLAADLARGREASAEPFGALTYHRLPTHHRHSTPQAQPHSTGASRHERHRQVHAREGRRRAPPPGGEKRRERTVRIILIAVVVLIVAGIAGATFMAMKKSDSKVNASASPSATGPLPKGVSSPDYGVAVGTVQQPTPRDHEDFQCPACKQFETRWAQPWTRWSPPVRCRSSTTR